MLGKTFLVDLTAEATQDMDRLETQMAMLQRVAESSGARLMLCSVVEPPPKSASPIEVEDRLLAIRKRKAEVFLREIEKQLPPDRKEKSRILVGKPFIEISQLVMAHGIQLVVSFAKDGIGHPVNSRLMHLVRKCPCAVWLWSDSTEHPRRDGPLRVVVAIDREIFAGSKTAEAMANSLMKAAVLSVGAREALITLIHAWRPYGLDVLKDSEAALEPDTLSEYLAGQRFAQTLWLNERHADLRDCVKHHLTRSKVNTACELLDGVPTELIPDWLAAHDADLLILGTVGTGALPGQLIGDTAETLLLRTRMPVLTVKPADFRSPVIARESILDEQVTPKRALG